MKSILELLADEDERVLTPNAIGYKLGVERVVGGSGQGGRGRGHRVFGPAQRVIFPLNRLEALGLVFTVSRPDGLSGRAYGITDAGLAEIGR